MLRDLFGSHLDNQAQAFLYSERVTPQAFLEPAGEPALFAPQSLSWRIFKNPVTLYIGGIAAVILEFAEPKVRAGVWDWSSFRTDPVTRMKRTGLAAMVTVYAARSVAEDMIAHVNRLHGKVTGTTEAGETYRADDPDLLDWVQVTATYGFLEAYAAYAGGISDEDRDRCYAEAAAGGQLYGTASLPRDRAGQQAVFAARLPRFEASPVIFEFLDLTRKARTLPPPANLGQGLLIRAAVEIVPEEIRAVLGLGDNWRLKDWERPLVARLARTSDRIVLPSAPPALACRRLGLPEDWLYR